MLLLNGPLLPLNLPVVLPILPIWQCLAALCTSFPTRLRLVQLDPRNRRYSSTDCITHQPPRHPNPLAKATPAPAWAEILPVRTTRTKGLKVSFHRNASFYRSAAYSAFCHARRHMTFVRRVPCTTCSTRLYATSYDFCSLCSLHDLFYTTLLYVI